MVGYESELPTASIRNKPYFSGKLRSITGTQALKNVFKEVNTGLVGKSNKHPDKKYDRLGLNDEYETILDVPIPKLSIPVAPGRNLVIILEVAAMNHRLKGLGYIPAKELGDRIERRVKQTTQS